MQTQINKDKEFWESMAGRHGAIACGYLNGYQPYEEFLRRWVFNAQIKIREEMKILDIGAGVGNWCRFLAKKGALVTGIDISSRMIEMAKELAEKEGLSINYRNVAIEDANFQAESFDLIFSITVLQHITDEDLFRRAVKNIVRMIKKDGRICFIESSPRDKSKNIEDARYMVYRDIGQWREIFKQAGCNLVCQRPVRFLTHRVFSRISSVKPKALRGALMIAPISIDIFLSTFLARPLLRHSDLNLFVLEKDREAA